MQVVVIGAGRLGRAVGHALDRRSVPTRLLSRSTGFDVLEPERSVDIGEADVVVEATDIFTQDRERATHFFTRSTRSVGAAAREAGARHVLVSIVNCELPALAGNGYYAGKAEQERIAREENPELTLVRSTQWYEFSEQNLRRMRIGRLSVVPSMRIQPVALETVAELVADCVCSDRAGTLHQVAGPEETTLWKITRALPDPGGLVAPLPVPGPAGRALRDGTLLPGPEVEVAGPGFRDWLAEQTRDY